MALRAWKNNTDVPTWTIREEGLKSTYHSRTFLKKGGATWNGRSWTCTEAQRQAMQIPRMIRVRVSVCHEPRNFAYVPENKAVVGNRVDSFCGMCDSHYIATILDVLDND